MSYYPRILLDGLNKTTNQSEQSVFSFKFNVEIYWTWKKIATRLTAIFCNIMMNEEGSHLFMIKQ